MLQSSPPFQPLQFVPLSPHLGMHQPLDGEEVWGFARPGGRIQQVSGQLGELGVEGHMPEGTGKGEGGREAIRSVIAEQGCMMPRRTCLGWGLGGIRSGGVLYNPEGPSGIISKI